MTELEYFAKKQGIHINEEKLYCEFYPYESIYAKYTDQVESTQVESTQNTSSFISNFFTYIYSGSRKYILATKWYEPSFSNIC